MKKFVLASLGLTVAGTAGAANLITNGSFESGLSSWSPLGGPTAKYVAVSPAPDGITAIQVTNRTQTFHAPSQNLLPAMNGGAISNGGFYTTRFLLLPHAPCLARCVLNLTDAAGTSKVILAERVARTNGVWLEVRGTTAIRWQPPLSSATLGFEIGQSWETNSPGFAMDHVRIQRDLDADGLPDDDELLTNPALADSNTNGLPDRWETDFGVSDPNGDPDHDGFTNWQEFCAATNPTNALSFPGQCSVGTPTAQAQALAKWLALLPARTNAPRVAIGQHLDGTSGFPAAFSEYVSNLFTLTGKWPAVLGLTYNHPTAIFQISSANPQALSWWTNGGLVLIHWEPNNPWTGAFAGDQRNVNLPDLLNPAAPVHATWMSYLDSVAAGLQELRDAGIPVLFKTLHEQNGAWYWWGRRKQADYVALWRQMHDYFTHTKGLTNLLWVFEASASPHASVPVDYYYPGDDVTDTVGFSIYHDTFQLTFDANEIFRAYPRIYAWPEVGTATQYDGTWTNTIALAAVTNRNPRCSFYVAWNSFTNGATIKRYAIVENRQAVEVMNDPLVLDRSELDWQNVPATNPPPPVPVEILQNGAFTNGFANWQTNGPASVKFLLATTPDGAPALTVSNRASLLHTIKQDVLAALTNGAGANGRSYTTRYRVRTDAPASTRLALSLATGTSTNKLILAERVVRTNGVWLDVRGTLPVSWPNALTAATLSVEVGQSWETNYPAFSVANLRMQSDADGDGLPDVEEIATNPWSADTDGDGLPDEWELQNDFDPVGTNDRDGDPDHDGFTNFQEFHAATNPRDDLSFPGRPANPNMNATARAVLLTLALAPSRTNGFPGQHISYPSEFTNYVVGLQTNTGFWPALVEFQYDDGASAMQVATMNPLARQWWANGGLVALKFNPRNPWTGGPQSVTNPSLHGPVDLPGLLDPASSAPASYATNLTANTRLLAWLDEAAAGLAELQSDGVVVLYRTLAEQNGRWFWWGGRRQADYVALWRFCYDYFTHTKKLNNLIWVLESDSGVHPNVPADYYFPGADCVDVFGHNLYSDTWELPFAADQLFRDYAKVYAIPQAGPGTTRDGTWSNTTMTTAITNHLPRCSWFGVWNSFNSGGYQRLAIVDNANAAALLQHPWSLTRDEVNWTTNTRPPSLQLKRTGAALELRWQGGVLQTSSNLLVWADVLRPVWPMTAVPGNQPMGYWRTGE